MDVVEFTTVQHQYQYNVPVPCGGADDVEGENEYRDTGHGSKSAGHVDAL